MAKWHYCVLELLGRDVALTINGQPSQFFKKQEWETFIERLGADGWRLVSTSGTIAQKDVWCYFKRPLAA